jgi:oxygen-dependent protoporphyrinogen oxidase
MKSVVVIGSGMSGLTAARKLSESGWSVTVLERNRWVGGRVREIACDDARIDVGASFVTDFYFHTRDIMKLIGLEKELVRFSLDSGVNLNGKIKPLWPVADMVKGGLLPISAMIRIVLGTMTLAPKWASLNPGELESAIAYDTETAQSWSKRVYGRDVTDRVIKPVLRGVVHWDAETTSRAVLFTMLKAFVAYPHAYVPRTGMAALPRQMADGLAVRTGAQVLEVVGRGAGWTVAYDLDGRRETLTVDAVVCSAPATEVPRLVPKLTGEERGFFDGIRYSSTAVAVVKVDSPDALRRSIWFTAEDQPVIVGVTPHVFRDQARADSIVRISLSDAAYRSNAHLSDAELGQFILDSARGIPQLSPILSAGKVIGLARWPQALPIFDVGHLRKVRSWTIRQGQSKSLAFAGDYLHGPYMEGAVRSGLEAAAQLEATR